MNKILLLMLTLLVASALILSACAAQGSSPNLAEISWRLVSYGPVGKQTSAAPGIETSLDFGKDGRVSGNLGCNSFSGNYEVKGGKVIFSRMISTMMACPGSQMEQERVTLNVMKGTVRFLLQDNTLTIYAASGESAIILSR